jgi:hypothetical protein
MDNELIFMRLTGPCNAQGGYPWQEVIHIHAAQWMATERRGGNVKGEPGYDPAFDLNSDRTLGEDVITYEARRLPETQEWIFDGRN